MLLSAKALNLALMRNKILIYCDYGTNDINNLKRGLEEYFRPRGIDVGITDAHGIIKDNNLNEDVLAFVMPGGRATPYLEKLKMQGNQAISHYVASGGQFLGICAGAYYASRKVYFETDIKELSIIQECGLNILDAETVGTLYKELNISPYTKDFNSISAVRIRWLADKQCYTACYHGGPYFRLNHQSNITVLAEYDLPKRHLPAIIMQDYGKGKVIGCGLHIEDKGTDLQRFLFTLHKDKGKAQKVITTLEQNEKSRLLLFNKVMDYLQK